MGAEVVRCARVTEVTRGTAKAGKALGVEKHGGRGHAGGSESTFDWQADYGPEDALQEAQEAEAAEKDEAAKCKADADGVKILLKQENEEVNATEEGYKGDAPVATYIGRVQEVAALYPKLSTLLAKAEDPEAAMKGYLAQVKAFEKLGKEIAKGSCVKGEACEVEFPTGEGPSKTYTLEKELPCAGSEADFGKVVTEAVVPSAWSSPKEARNCPKDAILSTSSTGFGTKGQIKCKAACDGVDKCNAIGFVPSTGSCSLCDIRASHQLVKDGAEVHSRIRRSVLKLTPDDAGRRYVCSTDTPVRIVGWIDVTSMPSGQHAVCFENDPSCEVQFLSNDLPFGGKLALAQLQEAPPAELDDADATILRESAVYEDDGMGKQVATLRGKTPVKVLKLSDLPAGKKAPSRQERQMVNGLPEKIQIEWAASDGSKQGWIRERAEAGGSAIDLTRHLPPESSAAARALEEKLWQESRQKAEKHRTACIGAGTKVLAEIPLSPRTGGSDPTMLVGTISQTAINVSGVLRMCYCPTGNCIEASEGVGFLKVLPSCQPADFEEFTKALLKAEVACSGIDTCANMRANATCLLQADPLIFMPVRRFDVQRQELVGEPVKNCWSWATDHPEDPEVKKWRAEHASTWAFAERWQKECGTAVQRTQICGAYQEGGVSRWIREHMGADVQADSWAGKALAAMGAQVWKTQRNVQDSLSALWNLGEPDTYSAAKGKLTCPPEMVIGKISFASYGTPMAKCGEMKRGECDAGPSVLAAAQSACMWRRACQVRPFGAKGETLFKLTSPACEEAKKRGNFNPSLVMEATCVQLEENHLEKIIAAKPQVQNLSEALVPVVKAVVQSTAETLVLRRREAGDLVDNVCSDCRALLKRVGDDPITGAGLKQDVCPNSGKLALTLKGMCDAAPLVGEASFLPGYIHDVEMSFGRSLFGNGNAARREVCKDIRLCGFDSNVAVATLYPASDGSGVGVADSVRSRLLVGYENETKALSDQGSMCSACALYLDPNMVSVDVWDSDYFWEAALKDKKGSLKAAKDDYLGGVTLDLSQELKEGRRSGDYLAQGLLLEPDSDRNEVEEVTGKVYFSWSVDDSNLLTIRVVRATGLARGDWDGTSDPYAKVSIVGGKCLGSSKCYDRTTDLGQTQARARTKYISSTLNPTWDMTFTFQLATPGGPGTQPTSVQGRIFAEALQGADNRADFLNLRRAFGSRTACMHIGMCEYATDLGAAFSRITAGLQLGYRVTSISKELTMKADIDARFDEIMVQLNTYPCRSIFVPKNLLLMFTTWRNLQEISKTVFKMRHNLDDAYMAYIRNRNQQVLRGLFHSDVMKQVPSYLRGLIETSVTSMLTGRQIGWPTLLKQIAIAFKRYAVATLGRMVTGPIMMAISLIQLVINGGKMLFYDFLYKFLYQGIKEGKSAAELWKEAKEWIKSRGKESYNAVKDALFGSNKCSNTADGVPSYATGADAKKLFAVGKEDDSLLQMGAASNSTEEDATLLAYISTGSNCGGKLDNQDFGVYQTAASGGSLSQIQAANSYPYIGTCYRSEQNYVYSYSCLYCSPPCYYDGSRTVCPSCGWCWHWETTSVPYSCEKIGYYVDSATFGNGWSFDRDWHMNEMYKLAAANPGVSACQLYDLVQKDGEAQAAVKQQQYDAAKHKALMIMMYIAIAIYVVVYLVCVYATFPSYKMLTSKGKGSQSAAMIAKSTLGCVVWPATFALLSRQAAEEENQLTWRRDQDR